MAKSGKNKKRLTYEDREIWSRITNTVKPLSSIEKNFPNSFLEEFEADLQKHSSPQSVTKLQSSAAPVFHPPVQKRPLLSTEKIDDKTTKKISRGKVSIDGRLDLHGYHQQEAYQILYNYVENAYFSGKRTILVITGKGNFGRGVLRENVPKWLAGAKFRSYISGFAQSHAVHGGAGAIYIKIRRKR